MTSERAKRCPAIACCGLDCGLCPQFHSKGTSRCPGCGGPGFAGKHPACGILACCVKKHGLETCGECGEFPCGRLAGWDAGDSFVSHAVSLRNLREIKETGLEPFLAKQHQRMDILAALLDKHDDGRSKSFYCLATALLPLPALEGAMNQIAAGQANQAGQDPAGKKAAARRARSVLDACAGREGIVVRLRKVKNT